MKLSAGSCLSAAACLALAAGLAAQSGNIRVNVNLVRVLATVKDSSGRLIGSLNKDDFTVYDNNVPQKIAIFERRTEQPLSVALLVDISGSTAKDLKYEVDSVGRFLKTLFGEGNPNDSAALYAFNYQVTKQNSFTRNQNALERSLKSLRGEAGTSLYDAIYLTGQDLEEREGRRVMVIVTDGGDTTSSKDFHAALEAAQRADAVIYPILVVPISNDAGRNVGGENALTTMAAGTGGRVFAPTLGAELDRAFVDIIEELRTQYLVAYYPHEVPLTKNRFHTIGVKLSKPNLRVLSRNGYYGESEDETGSSNGRVSVAPDRSRRRADQ